MDNDPVFSQVYQQTFEDVKENSERDMNDLRAMHKKYDTYYDKEQMKNKLKSRWFNLEDVDEDEDIQFSTDFTDEGEDFMYKRYKVLHYESRQRVEEYQDVITGLQRDAEEWWPQGEALEVNENGEDQYQSLDSILATAIDEQANLTLRNMHLES